MMPNKLPKTNNSRNYEKQFELRISRRKEIKIMRDILEKEKPIS